MYTPVPGERMPVAGQRLKKEASLVLSILPPQFVKVAGYVRTHRLTLKEKSRGFLVEVNLNFPPFFLFCLKMRVISSGENTQIGARLPVEMTQRLHRTWFIRVNHCFLRVDKAHNDLAFYPFFCHSLFCVPVVLPDKQDVSQLLNYRREHLKYQL